jgi:hypothetical protein
MIRHQNVFADKYATFQADMAKLPESFMNLGVRENGFAVFGIRSDEVERMAREKLLKTFQSGRTFVRVHDSILAARCERRKDFEKRRAVTDPPLQPKMPFL